MHHHLNSDSHSSTQHQDQSLYDKIVNFNNFLELKRHSDLNTSFANFINHANMKAMFVFGPSGCSKRLWITHQLQKHFIPYQELSEYELWNENYDQEQSHQRILIGLKHLITNELQSTVVSKVTIFHEFPRICNEFSNQENQSNFDFKRYFFSKINSSHTKLIFLLNSSIYNISYFPSNIQTITFLQVKPYGFQEIQKIFKHFLSVNELELAIPKDHSRELLKLSSGDIRMLLLDYYLACMQQKAYEKQKFLKNKENKKITLFHGLGKFLYAKRYDAKINKQRMFTREELEVEDPPFYFKPQNQLVRMGAGLNIFEELVIENYPKRYGSVRDIRQACELFCHLDSTFPSYVSHRSIKNEDQASSIYTFLLTWGIILKNKCGIQVPNQYCSFKKSANSFMEKQKKKKIQLIKRFYKRTSLRNLVKTAYILRGTKLASRCVISSILVSRIFSAVEMPESDMVEEEEEDRVQEDALSYMVNENSLLTIMKQNHMDYIGMKLVEEELRAEEEERLRQGKGESSSEQSDIDS